MRRIRTVRLGILGVVALLVAALTGWSGTSIAEEPAAEIARLKAEIDELKGRLPSQSHAMMDVDYHFTNLWFAGQSKNWALGSFTSTRRDRICAGRFASFPYAASPAAR